MDIHQIDKLFNNEEFVSKFEKLSNTKEAVMLFREYGFEVSEADIIEAKNLVNDDGELSSDVLAIVAGGRSFLDTISPSYWIGYGISKLISKKGKFCLPF